MTPNAGSQWVPSFVPCAFSVVLPLCLLVRYTMRSLCFFFCVPLNVFVAFPLLFFVRSFKRFRCVPLNVFGAFPRFFLCVPFRCVPLRLSCVAPCACVPCAFRYYIRAASCVSQARTRARSNWCPTGQPRPPPSISKNSPADFISIS